MTERVNMLTTEDIRVLRFATNSYKDKLKAEHWKVMPYLPGEAVSHYVSNSLKLEASVNSLVKKLEQLFVSQFEKDKVKPIFDADDMKHLVTIYCFESNELNMLLIQAQALNSTLSIEDKYINQVVEKIKKDIAELKDVFERFNGILNA